MRDDCNPLGRCSGTPARWVLIDTAISKTVNVPADYPYDAFKGLYLQARNACLKGLATYRPNLILGSVLSVGEAESSTSVPSEAVSSLPDPMRTVIESRPKGALLPWPICHDS
jgi:ribonucleoside-diphosphate reductase alpha chain